MALLRFSALLVFCWSAYIMMAPVDGKCLYCTSWNDTNCIQNLTAVEDSRWCDVWCFVRLYDNGTVERGCMDSDLVEEEAVKEQCQAPDCLYCDASVKVCNKHTICKSCDSSTDPDCAQTDATKDTFNTICSAADTACVAKVRDTDKHVERRCAIDGDVESNLTQVCTGGICNVGIYPSQRRRCYQCELGSKCANLAANTEIASTPCLLYDADEQCHMSGSSDVAMLRGCRSDNSTTCGSDQPDSECAFCNTDNCNNLSYKRDQTLRCVQCKVGEETTSAPTAKSVVAAAEETETEPTICTEAMNCQNQLLYSQADACYSQVKDGVTHYGCLYDRDVATLGDCKEANGCSTCTDTDGCNKDIATPFTCIRCRNDVNPDCLDKAEDMEGQTCTNAVTDTADELCYWGTWNNVLIRGCWVDADPRMQRTCNDTTTEQCLTCSGPNCNTKAANGAAMLTIAPGMLLLMVCAVFSLKQT